MLVTLKPAEYGEKNRYYKKRIMWTANQISAFNMRDRSSKGDVSFVLNIPSHNLMSAPWQSLNATRYGVIFIKWIPEGGSVEYQLAVKHFITDCKAAFNSTEANTFWFDNAYEDTDTMSTVVIILDTIFNVIIIITMLLCLFSLCSSMSANLMD